MGKYIDINEAIRLYRDEGLPSTKVSKIMGCAVQTLIVRLRDYGVTIRSCGNHQEKCSFEIMKHEYEILNMSTTEIAKKHNMDPVSIWERLKKGGVQLRNRKEEAIKSNTKIPLTEHPKICQRYMDNPTDSSADIAKDYGVHKTTIIDILKKNGIKLESGGPRSGNWQGGITPLHTQIRNCEKAQEWKKKCMERDEFKCQITKRQGRLQVHHKKSFSKIFNEFLTLYKEKPKDQLFDLSQTYNDFWAIDNGLTLLADIHQELHKRLYDPCLALEIHQLRQREWSINKIVKCLKKDWHTVDRILKLTS